MDDMNMAPRPLLLPTRRFKSIDKTDSKLTSTQRSNIEEWRSRFRFLWDPDSVEIQDCDAPDHGLPECDAKSADKVFQYFFSGVPTTDPWFTSGDPLIRRVYQLLLDLGDKKKYIAKRLDQGLVPTGESMADGEGSKANFDADDVRDMTAKQLEILAALRRTVNEAYCSIKHDLGKDGPVQYEPYRIISIRLCDMHLVGSITRTPTDFWNTKFHDTIPNFIGDFLGHVRKQGDPKRAFNLWSDLVRTWPDDSGLLVGQMAWFTLEVVPDIVLKLWREEPSYVARLPLSALRIALTTHQGYYCHGRCQTPANSRIHDLLEDVLSLHRADVATSILAARVPLEIAQRIAEFIPHHRIREKGLEYLYCKNLGSLQQHCGRHRYGEQEEMIEEVIRHDSDSSVDKKWLTCPKLHLRLSFPTWRSEMRGFVHAHEGWQRTGGKLRLRRFVCQYPSDECPGHFDDMHWITEDASFEKALDKHYYEDDEIMRDVIEDVESELR